MNVLMVGSGKGSWQIRGEQLGAAMGARVVTVPTIADWQWAHVAVLVKRAALHYAAAAHAAHVPIVWDALDFWSQPGDNHLPEADARRLFGTRIAAIRPALVIGATRQMADAATALGVTAAYLPHHARPGLTARPARARVELVAYEGNAGYLGDWRQVIEQACQRRGWRFVVNPPDLSAADLIVAFRGGVWDGWMCREWKSGVKVVNAWAAGRPIITQPSVAFLEIGHSGSAVSHATALDAAFDQWAGDVAAREHLVKVATALGPYLTVQARAVEYAALLAGVRDTCAA